MAKVQFTPRCRESKSMIEGIKRILAIPELKAKVVFTLMMLLVCRIGAHIPVPGINGDAAVEIFRTATGGGQNLFQLMDVFSGGAFAQDRKSTRLNSSH